MTGATSSAGPVAFALADQDYEVIVHGRDAVPSETVKAIEDRGGQARFVGGDLSESADVTGLVAEAGQVDVLVNNAGFSWFGPTADLDNATFDKLFAANVRGAYQLVAALAPAMAKQGSGSIVSVDSMVGRIGLSGAAAYGATKAALTAMTGRGPPNTAPPVCGSTPWPPVRLTPTAPTLT